MWPIENSVEKGRMLGGEEEAPAKEEQPEDANVAKAEAEPEPEPEPAGVS